MKKSLSELTLEELWALFPIFLIPYNTRWPDFYNEMETFLYHILPEYSVQRISHIGSTAVKGIWAKNIIDILIEASPDDNMEELAKVMEDNGFIRMSSDINRISLNCGYTENGFAEKVYHLHLRQTGDHDELYFRDYLNEHPQTAKAYEQLKLDLWKQFEHDRDGYTNAKSHFVKEWTLEAKRIYTNRY